MRLFVKDIAHRGVDSSHPKPPGYYCAHQKYQSETGLGLASNCLVSALMQDVGAIFNQTTDCEENNW
jgi:hypothetical protein